MSSKKEMQITIDALMSGMKEQAHRIALLEDKMDIHDAKVADAKRTRDELDSDNVMLRNKLSHINSVSNIPPKIWGKLT